MQVRDDFALQMILQETQTKTVGKDVAYVLDDTTIRLVLRLMANEFTQKSRTGAVAWTRIVKGVHMASWNVDKVTDMSERKMRAPSIIPQPRNLHDEVALNSLRTMIDW